MTERLMDINAYTTLDFVEASVRSHVWSDEAVGTLDVRLPEDTSGVVLEYELDQTSVDELPQHAVRFEISPEDARRLADELQQCAEETGGDE